MFINFWYPAGRSDELDDEPRKVRMLGQDFVLFRDANGAAHCLSNTCCHRGGSLSGGKVIGQCIQCPYHGWQFDGGGECRKVPSLGPGGKIPPRARIDAYPTEERYGLIFAFLGDLPEAERPTIMDIPEYGEEGWRATIQHFEWNFDYKRSIENGIDPGHNEFVHPTHGFSGEREDYSVGPLRLTETEWGTGFFNDVYAPPLPEKKMQQASGRTEAGVIEAGTGHHGISMVWTYIHPTPEMKIHQYLYEAPVDAENTSLWLINLRNFLLEPEHDERVMERNQYVAFQDRDILTQVHPTVTPPTNTKEIFLPADLPIGRYRERIAEWQARGWRIDVDQVARSGSQVAYAIPSPARQTTKGWALDAIPLIEGERARAKRAV